VCLYPWFRSLTPVFFSFLFPLNNNKNTCTQVENHQRNKKHGKKDKKKKKNKNAKQEQDDPFGMDSNDLGKDEEELESSGKNETSETKSSKESKTAKPDTAAAGATH
jgi:hypothetical protein